MESSVPQQAITAFEQATGLSLCFHDFRRSLWPFVDATRNEHVNPVCRLVKSRREAACKAFCAHRLRQEAKTWTAGTVKRCHADVIELYLPVFIDGAVEWILYAGVRRAAPTLTIPLSDHEPSGRSGPWAPTIARLPALDDVTASWQLELLRQLAARLVAWRTSLRERLPELSTRGGMPTDDARRSTITYFLSKHHRNAHLRLRDLAKQLALSEDRVGHVVRELFDTTFQDLLVRNRLDTAQGLLRHSDLPLREVARQSGFGSRAQFFHHFQQRLGTTPLVWRQAQTA